MALVIKAYQGGYNNADLRNSNFLDLGPAAVTQWSNQGFTAEMWYAGSLITVVVSGAFSANGTPATMNDISGQADSSLLYMNGVLYSQQQWQPGYDLQYFNPPLNLALEYAYLDSGLLFIGSPSATEAAAADKIQGGASTDVFVGYGGHDIFYGGGGLDYAVFRGDLYDYAMSLESIPDLRVDDTTTQPNPNVTGIAVVDTVAGRDSRTAIVEIERLQFNDVNLAFDIDGVAGQAYRLYKAAFNRQPDEGGLGYWINELDKGFNLWSVASGFLASAEFISQYGNNVSDREFIDALYQNVLHRGADQAGFEYWERELANGYNRENILLSFSESAENQANVISLIADGIRYENWDPIVV